MNYVDLKLDYGRLNDIRLENRMIFFLITLQIQLGIINSGHTGHPGKISENLY